MQVLHRDLKLSNLLYNHRGELRVADFGLARRVGSAYVGGVGAGGAVGSGVGDLHTYLTPKVVSLWYRPPELLFGAEYYDQGVDNWGAGCVMGELLRGKPLMDGRNEMDQLQKMVRFCLFFCSFFSARKLDNFWVLSCPAPENWKIKFCFGETSIELKMCFRAVATTDCLPFPLRNTCYDFDFLCVP